jgi:LacI family transcriptional regulator
MQHLVSLGHRRIGFIYGVPAHPAGLDRLEPYLQTLQAIGVSNPMELVERCGDEIEDGYQAALRVLRSDDRPTALLAINDLLAIGVIRAAADLGLSLPRDLSLASYDDIFVSNYLVPRLTSATKDAERMGRTAVDLLVRRIADPGRPGSTIEFESRVVYRESIGPPPVSPPASQ